MTTATPGTLPEPGQLAEVRQQRWVVTEIARSALQPSPLHGDGFAAQHLISLASVEDDGLGEELQVVWELEPGARALEKVALPEPTGFDEPRRLDARSADQEDWCPGVPSRFPSERVVLAPRSASL